MKNFGKQSILLLYIILFIGCLPNKKLIPSIPGYYRIHFYKSSSTGRTIIFGNIREYKTNSTIPISAVKLDNVLSYKADSAGRYKFTVKPNKYTFTGIGMPFRSAETDPIIVKRGDSVRIDFYLKPDPLILLDMEIDYTH